jgi:hypothetical protein
VVARTRDELLELFDEQIGFLELSNDAFDDGKLAEAKRLAVALRNLFHHTADTPRGTSHALINQLGLQDTLMWIDTAGMPDPKNLLTTWGLVQTGIHIEDGKGKPVMRAPLGDYPQNARIRTTVGVLPRGSRLYFEAWWTNPTTKDSDGTLFCRKDFVLALANQEGGAHIDPEIKAAYDRLANSNSMGWSYQEGDAREIPLENPVPYAVRQISYEVVESIRQQQDRVK